MEVFFDLDGTLLDISFKYYHVYKKYIYLHGGKPLSIETYWTSKRNLISDKEILFESGVSIDDIQIYKNYIIENIENIEMLQIDVLFPTVRDVMEAICSRHRCHLVTARRNRNNLLFQLKQLDIERYFRKIITCGINQFILSGNTPKALSIMENGYSLPAIIIGDSEMEIKTGKILGFKTCATTTGLRTRNVLEKLNPDYIVDSLTEIEKLIP